MSQHKYKKRNHFILRSPQFDEYLKLEWEQALPVEKMMLQSSMGRINKIENQIENYSLDKKLMMLTYLNKQFCLLIWDKNKGATFADFQRVFNYYISKEQNMLAEETIKKLNVFCIDQRQAAKHFFAGTYKFSEVVYRAAETGSMHKYITSFRTPNVSISQTERNERNFDVYKLFNKILMKGYYLDTILLPYKIDYGHFRILSTLFCAERVLNKEETIEKDNVLNYETRTSPSPQRLNFLIDILQFVDKHVYDDKDENGEKIKKTVYTISAKGIYTFLEIMNKLSKDE